MLERERVREQEAEPIQYDTAIQDNIRRQRSNREILESLPHVIPYESRPWTQGISCTHKYMDQRHHDTPISEWGAPFHTLNGWHELLRPGHYMGTHRHISEAMFYIMEGKGWEIHDGVRWEWEAGDIMCVPSYCIHTHFSDPVVGARMFATGQRLYDFMGLNRSEQLEVHPSYRDVSDEEKKLLGADEDLQKVMAERMAHPEFQGEPQDHYEQHMKSLSAEVNWRQQCVHVVRGSEQPWRDTRFGRIKYLVHPSIPTGLLTFEAWLQELPPGGKSGVHRHMGEEFHMVLEGSGYDIHDGVKWEWNKNDVVVMPHNTVHQHVNTDPYNPAVSYHVQSRLFDFVGHSGIVHLEDAPDYTGTR